MNNNQENLNKRLLRVSRKVTTILGLLAVLIGLVAWLSDFSLNPETNRVVVGFGLVGLGLGLLLFYLSGPMKQRPPTMATSPKKERVAAILIVLSVVVLANRLVDYLISITLPGINSFSLGALAISILLFAWAIEAHRMYKENN